jgi:hypothetical protein
MLTIDEGADALDESVTRSVVDRPAIRA